MAFCRLISRARDTLDVELPLKLIFRNPSVEQLADAIETIRMTQELQQDDESDDRADDQEEFTL